MDSHRFDLHELSDRQVLDRLLKLHQTSAEVMADLLCHLAEVERRGLHLREATRSVFKYAVEVLGCTEDEAWRRVTAAQTAARFPAIFELIATGELTLTSVNMLRSVLTEENHAAVLAEAKHKTKAELEVMVARLAPKPDAPTRLARVVETPRRTAQVARTGLPLLATPCGPDVPSLAQGLGMAPAAAATAPATPTRPTKTDPATAEVPNVTSSLVASAAQPHEERAPSPLTRPDPARLAPLSPHRWKLTLTVGAEAERALRTARDLTPGGDLARIVERAVIEYAEKLEARKLAKLKGHKRRSALASALARARDAEPVPPSDAVVRASALARAADAELPTCSDAVAPPSALARADADPPRTSNRCGRPPGGHRPSIPRAVIREVVERDGGQCGYVCHETGRRCSETANLHIHHLVAYARGGATTAENLGLRCAAHNFHLAVLDFGVDHMAKAIARWRGRGAR